MRRIVLGIALSACAEVPDAPPDVPVLALQVDVTSGSGEVFTMPDGTMGTQASFTRSYDHLADRPAVARLPLTIIGTPVEIELGMCDKAVPTLTVEQVMYTDVSQLDQFGVVGKLAWSCDYADGSNATGNQDSGIIADPNQDVPTL